MAPPASPVPRCPPRRPAGGWEAVAGARQSAAEAARATVRQAWGHPRGRVVLVLPLRGRRVPR
eukprot:10797311-Lingulodinium_polyedra.AAC.1